MATDGAGLAHTTAIVSPPYIPSNKLIECDPCSCGGTKCVEQSSDGAVICAGGPGLQERIEDATVLVDFVRRLLNLNHRHHLVAHPTQTN